MNSEHFIVNSERIGFHQGYKTSQTNYSVLHFISQKEQRHQANPSLRAICTLVRVKRKATTLMKHHRL